MMQLGFVSAIVPTLDLRAVLKLAADIGYDSVEVMCWPSGKADRRYAGITHIDVDQLTDSSIAQINAMQEEFGVSISGLGYYPNPLLADLTEREKILSHMRKIIDATKRLGLNQFNTFVGRDQAKTIDDNWPIFLEVWRPLVKFAEEHNVRIGIENCPMLFSNDEWPGGKNLAYSPAIWRRMFEDIPSDHFGLNYDPSHPTWLFIDQIRPIAEFGKRIFHVHAKDARIDWEKIYQHGILNPACHTPKLPGSGDVPWGKFFGALSDAGYRGHVAVEVEDRAYEGSLEDRITSLKIAHNYLRQFVPKTR